MSASFRSFARRLFSGKALPRYRRPRTHSMFRPRIELLENRNMLTTLSVADGTFSESDGQAAFLIVASQVTGEVVTVEYSIAGGSAVPGEDVSGSGTLTFQPYESYKMASIFVNDDALTEEDEDFYLELSNALNAEILNSGRGTISGNDHPPVMHFFGDQVVDEESPLTMTASAFDPDSPGNSVTYSLDPGAPSGAAIDAESGNFSWTPTEADGPGVFFVTIRATETGAPYHSTAETIQITVDEVNISPETFGFADVNVLEDADPVTIDVFAAFDDVEDADDQMLYEVVDNSNPDLFSSVLLDQVTGELQLAFALNAFGDASITVRAMDSWGAWVDATLYINVAAVNDPPVISDFVGTRYPDDVWVFTGTVTDVDDDPTSWQPVFGGVLSGYSFEAFVEADGVFRLRGVFSGLQSGTASAEITDAQGAVSNLALFDVFA